MLQYRSCGILFFKKCGFGNAGIWTLRNSWVSHFQHVNISNFHIHLFCRFPMGPYGPSCPTWPTRPIWRLPCTTCSSFGALFNVFLNNDTLGLWNVAMAEVWEFTKNKLLILTWCNLKKSKFRFLKLPTFQYFKVWCVGISEFWNVDTSTFWKPDM